MGAGSAAITAVRACGAVAAVCDQRAEREEGVMEGCKGGDMEAWRHAGLEGGGSREERGARREESDVAGAAACGE